MKFFVECTISGDCVGEAETLAEAVQIAETCQRMPAPHGANKVWQGTDEVAIAWNDGRPTWINGRYRQPTINHG